MFRSSAFDMAVRQYAIKENLLDPRDSRTGEHVFRSITYSASDARDQNMVCDMPTVALALQRSCAF